MIPQRQEKYRRLGESSLLRAFPARTGPDHFIARDVTQTTLVTAHGDA